MRESKIFDTSTIKGIEQAERYKARLENKYERVIVTPIGLTRVRIEGKEAERLSCNQCQMLSINGVACHETGCPNSRKRYIDGEWVSVRSCFECGCEVLGDAECCADEN